MNKKNIFFVLVVCIVIVGAIVNYSSPGLASNLIYSYSVTKSYTENVENTTNYAKVPFGKEVTKKVDYYSGVELKDKEIPKRIEAELKDNFNKPVKFKQEMILTGPENGYKYRSYFITEKRDKGEYTIIEKNKITGKEKKYDGTYLEPSSQDPLKNWSRDTK